MAAAPELASKSTSQKPIWDFWGQKSCAGRCLLRQGDRDFASSVYGVSSFPAFFAVLPKLALGGAAALAALSLSPGSAQAYVVTVDGVQYDVTTFTGDYDSNINRFETPANGGVMPWWGSTNTASKFAARVGSSLGEPNTNSNSGSTFGPIFAALFDTGNIFGRYYGFNGRGGNYPYFAISSETRVWAQVAPAASASAPAPLPIVGAAAAFGFSRKLRKRIQGSRLPAGSREPLA